MRQYKGLAAFVVVWSLFAFLGEHILKITEFLFIMSYSYFSLYVAGAAERAVTERKRNDNN